LGVYQETTRRQKAVYECLERAKRVEGIHSGGEAAGLAVEDKETKQASY
jgi:hypothetical protein